MDASLNLRVQNSFTFQVSEGNLWTKLDPANINTMMSVETSNGDAEISLLSATAQVQVCPFSPNQQHCVYLEQRMEDSVSACNLNLSVEGQVVVQDISSRLHDPGRQKAQRVTLHNESLDAIAAWATSPRRLSYLVFTSGKPRRTAYLKPLSALRYVLAPSASFTGMGPVESIIWEWECPFIIFLSQHQSHYLSKARRGENDSFNHCLLHEGVSIEFRCVVLSCCVMDVLQI